MIFSEFNFKIKVKIYVASKLDTFKLPILKLTYPESLNFRLEILIFPI